MLSTSAHFSHSTDLAMKLVAPVFGGLALLLLSSCASHEVTLSNPRGEVYAGKLRFQGGYTGTLTVPRGPAGESFTGRYVCVDRTAVGSVVGIAPGATLAGSRSGEVQASGQWIGQGTKGSTLTAQVVVGRGGHGIGEATHSNGQKYRIAF